MLTGGPGGGKSTAVPFVKKRLEARGFTVLHVDEAATELIRAGVTRESCGSQLAFQIKVIEKQLALEKEAQAAAKTAKKPAVILCDRGILDGRGYLDEAEFLSALGHHGFDRASASVRYDAVFFLRSPAVDRPEFYTTANNDARSETPEESAAIDRNTLLGWSGCGYFRETDNTTDFEQKKERLVKQILEFLGSEDIK